MQNLQFPSSLSFAGDVKNVEAPKSTSTNQAPAVKDLQKFLLPRVKVGSQSQSRMSAAQRFAQRQSDNQEMVSKHS